MKRIVIVGAGYAGLQCALSLSRTMPAGAADILLVSKHDYHYPSTLLHRVSLGTYSARKARVFVRKVLDSCRVRFVKDIITGVDRAACTVQGQLDSYPYDYLVLAPGFRVNTFDTPGAGEHAFGIYSMNSADRILRHVEKAFTDFPFNPDPNTLRFAIVGAGFTGVEYAAELAEQLRQLCEICGIDHNRAHISLIGRHETILPTLGEKGGAAALRTLTRLGIDYVVGSATEVLEDGVMVRQQDGSMRKIDARTCLWAAGVKGNPLISQAGLPNIRDRVTVDGHLMVDGCGDTFVLGDCAAFTGEGEAFPYPQTGQIAQQMGRYAAGQLVSLVMEGRLGEPFVYHHKGTVCSLGVRDGVAALGKATITGVPAAMLKNLIENKWFFNLGGLGLVARKGQFMHRTSN